MVSAEPSPLESAHALLQKWGLPTDFEERTPPCSQEVPEIGWLSPFFGPSGVRRRFPRRLSDLVGQAFSLRGAFSPFPGSRFDTTAERTYTGGMEVHLSPDKQARLQEIATRAGKNAEQMVEEAVDRMLEHLEHDERFIAAVEEGRSSARRGELLEHDEVVERIDKLLRS